jgi:antitoxin CptB
MKELDLLLTRYLRDRWPDASEAERACFEAFLELPDPQIAAYLVAGERAIDPAEQSLIDHLRRPPG